MIHISPWETTPGLMSTASKALKPNGYLIIYGPFKVNGQFTTESNAEFDKWLKNGNPIHGLRDVEKVQAEAEKAGLRFAAFLQMPANNFSLVFAKANTKTKH